VNDRYRMDGHKLLWHLDRVKAWGRGERISPLHIDLGITTGCNLACTYCYGVLQGRAGYGTNATKRFDMPKEPLLRLLSDAKKIGVRSIALIGEGENTLNPALYAALEHSAKISLDMSLATNGILIRQDKAEIMLSSLKWIRFNISSATPESYALIHQTHPEIFYKVVKNAEMLVKMKRGNKHHATLGLQMIITKQNADQIIPLAKLGKQIGVDYAVFKSCSDNSSKSLDSPDNEYLEMEPIFSEAELESTESYSVVIKRQKLRNLGLKDYTSCNGTQFILAISGNGRVFPCGHWFNIRQDEFLMGNVITSPLEEIVKSERYWEVQKKIQAVNVNHDCETNCRQHYINQFLSRVKDGKINLDECEVPEETPAHINFI